MMGVRKNYKNPSNLTIDDLRLVKKLKNINLSDISLMDCKLTQASIVELRIIPPNVNNVQAICPCCHQPFMNHRTQKSKIDNLKSSCSYIYYFYMSTYRSAPHIVDKTQSMSPCTSYAP